MIFLDKLQLFKLFFSSLRTRGLRRTVRISAYEFWYERKFGANTGYIIPVERLDYCEEAKTHAQPYCPSSFLFLHEIFCETQIDCRDAIFVDYGCGMGRALLFASALPFRKIIGVELSAELCKIAHQNMSRYYEKSKKHSPDWSIVNSDVRDFPIPDNANIFYMYNPFDMTIMGEVIDLIKASAMRQPRRCVVIYANPIHDQVLTGRGLIKLFGRRRDFAVYELPLDRKIG